MGRARTSGSNAVAPGATQTPLLQEGLDDPFVGPLIEGFAVPIGRRGKPEEIAALVEFLLGPDARFFCGSVVFCDGGTDAMTRADDIPPPWHPALADCSAIHGRDLSLSGVHAPMNP